MTTKFTARELEILKEVAWFASSGEGVGTDYYNAADTAIIKRQPLWDLISVNEDAEYCLSDEGLEFIGVLDDQNELADTVLETVKGEMEAQFIKRGEQRHAAPIWLSILTEEVGEVAKAINDKDINNLRTEIMQCAAVCASWLKWFDEMGKGE